MMKMVAIFFKHAPKWEGDFLVEFLQGGTPGERMLFVSATKQAWDVCCILLSEREKSNII